MAININYANEYLYWSQTEAVTVTLHQQSENKSVSVATALRESINRKSASYSGLSLSSDSVQWSIPVALLDSETLEIGDEIKDAGGVRWKVSAATLIRAGSSPTHWEAMCERIG